MRGEPGVFDFLNKALQHELTAVNQYWRHYRLLRMRRLRPAERCSLERGADRRALLTPNKQKGRPSRRPFDVLRAVI